MKTVSKKLLSLLLVAILLVSAIPFQAFATELGDDLGVSDPGMPDAGIPGAGAPDASIPDAGAPDTSDIVPLDEDTTVPHKDTHNSPWQYTDESGHFQVCENENCVRSGEQIYFAVHDFDKKTGSCKVCGYTCTSHNWNGDNICDICGMSCPQHIMQEVTEYVAPSCDAPGQNPDTECSYCGMHVDGTVIAPTGHSFSGGTCTKCGAEARKITLDPAPGTVKGAASITYTLVNDRYLINLPAADTRKDFTFVGWKAENGTIIYPNSTANVEYVDAMGTTFTALWSAKTRHVEVYAVLNGNYSSPLSGYVWQGEAPENGNLLDYLKKNVSSIVDTAVLNHPGYSWDGIFRDRLGNALKDGTSNQAQNVYVNFASVGYTLYFDADGGTVTPTSKTVYKGTKVGTLPTPFKEGMVFMGWKDSDGNLYTSETVYPNACDTMVKAVWKEMAKVYLRVYINGNFNTPDRLLEVDSFVVNDHISWSTIDSYLRKYYTPASGTTMVVNGLFDKAGWDLYRQNPSTERKSDIRVTANTGTEIYVMINGAKSGTTVLPTTPGTTVPVGGFWVRDLNGNLIWYPAGSTLPSGTGYWVYDNSGNPNIWVITGGSTVPTYIYIGSNPKTGDTAKLEIAAAVMVLAAAALITVMALRKKKSV